MVPSPLNDCLIVGLLLCFWLHTKTSAYEVYKLAHSVYYNIIRKNNYISRRRRAASVPRNRSYKNGPSIHPDMHFTDERLAFIDVQSLMKT